MADVSTSAEQAGTEGRNVWGPNGTFTWYGHSCIAMTTPGGVRVLFDPWLANPRSPVEASAVDVCDLLLVSHGHFDHLGDAIEISSRTFPTWVMVHELSLWLPSQLPEGRVELIDMNKGGTVDARGLRITMVRADHSAGRLPEGATLPVYLGEPVGFVLQLEDGRRVYFAGDTDVFGDMRLIGELHRPQFAFLPIGGHYTMGPREAALAVELLGVRTVVPIHYGTFPILAGTPAELRDALAARGLASVEVVAPEPGQQVPIPAG